MRRLAATALTVALLVAGAAASPASAKTHHEAKPKPKKAPGIGSTLTVLNQKKQTEAIKLVGIVDPAQGADQSTPDPGKRFVGIELQVTNRSKGTDSQSANDNTAIVGSNKQVYSSDVNSISECTDFGNGTYTLRKGESEIGCVTFQVPVGVAVGRVQYNPDAGFSTNNAEWIVSPPG